MYYTTIKKFREEQAKRAEEYASDWINVINRAWFTHPDLSTIGYCVVDTEKYDLVPKPSYTEKLIKAKEQEIANLEDQQTHYNKRVADQREKLQKEIDTLKQKK
jgi:hypothetical protein